MARIAGRLLLGLLGTGLAATAGTALAVVPPDPIRLHPVDGGHWQARAGLPDSRGSARQALVRWVSGGDDHPEVAAITGLEGQDTSTIEKLGFAVAGGEAGIIPCVRVAYEDALGGERELMLTPGRLLRGEPGREGWTVYSFDAGLPSGGTIVAIEIGVHADSEVTPPEPIRVRFDDVVVNGSVFTHPGDLGGAHPPEPV